MKKILSEVVNIMVDASINTFIRKLNDIIYKKERERELLRHFKIKIIKGFFTTKVEYEQREKPLTDEELDQLYNSFNL